LQQCWTIPTPASDDSDAGKWFRENVEFVIVPFMDKDGVEDGDQGKLRKPHDHNRDYGETPIYESVKALMAYVERRSDGKLVFFLDMHCPHLLWQRNLELFFVGATDSDIWKRVGRFSEILQKVQRGQLVFNIRNNLPFGEDWNTESAGTSAEWFISHVGTGISTALEIPYASAAGKVVTQDSAREFGRDLAVALHHYLMETAGKE